MVPPDTYLGWYLSASEVTQDATPELVDKRSWMEVEGGEGVGTRSQVLTVSSAEPRGRFSFAMVSSLLAVVSFAAVCVCGLKGLAAESVSAGSLSPLKVACKGERS